MKRKRTVTNVGLLIIALGFIGCATTEQVVSPQFERERPERIAIADVSGDIRGEAVKNQVGDYFAMELLRKGYDVIERQRVQELLAEQDFQLGDRTSPEEAAQIGQILNIPAVAMLTVNVDGEKISLTGRMVDVDTAQILWVGTGRGGSGRTFSTVLGAVTGGLLGTQVGDGRGRTAATIAGGVLGGAAGDALAPQTARVIQRTIQRIMEDMPAR